MMTCRLVVTSVICLTACLGAQKPQVAEQEQVESPDEYDRLVQEADSAYRAGDLDSAYKLYRRAVATPLFEVPNYSLFGRIGEVECLIGRVKKGKETLTDYLCMLDIAAGAQECYEPSEYGTLGPRNPSLSDRCFKTMCGEIYLAYYEDVSDALMKEIREKRAAAAKLLEECGETRTRNK